MESYYRGSMRRFASAVFRFLLCIAALSLLSCTDDSSDDDLFNATFEDPVPLTAAEVQGIVQAAAESIDDGNLCIAVVDRVGRILAVWRRDPTTPVSELNKTVSVARAAAFLSSSQGPLTSRTLEYISTFHFPPQFGNPTPLPFATLPPQRATVGVDRTAQGPLWQIFASNRGAPFAGFIPGQEIPAATNIDGSAPSPGLSYLPGAVPLYKPDVMGAGLRVVGAVGCYDPGPGTPNVSAMEFAALSGGNGFLLPGIPPEGAIFLVGQLLPNVVQIARPTGFGAGAFDPAGFFVPPTAGGSDPVGWIIGPLADPLLNLSQNDVMRIVDQGVNTANATRAAIRLPLGSTTKMVFAVTNLDGVILGAFRMPDAPVFSFDVSITKARAVVYYSGPNLLPADAIPGVPLGTAITTRTLGFLSQPFFPPTIDGRVAGPLFDVAVQNQDPAQFDRMGALPSSALRSGIIFFPGSAPLYNMAGQLIGGAGVSGDGVEQDDFVTAGAVRGFEPPLAIRADNYTFGGVRLPYLKFPQLPGPGG